LQSGKEDRAQLNWVYKNVLTDRKLGEFDFTLSPLPATNDRVTGPLRNTFNNGRKFFLKEYEQFDDEGLGHNRLELIYNVLVQQISVVQIDVQNPLWGPKIFDCLNSAQEPMTAGDLIRNDIFSRVAGESLEEIERIDQVHWQPFYTRFDVEGQKDLFEKYFFPFGLIHAPNTLKSQVYSVLRSGWDRWGPQEIVQELAVYQDHFLDIVTGSNSCGHEDGLANALKDLHETKLPTSIYPYLMQLSHSVKEGDLEPEIAKDILSVIESFLVRRAVVGLEPTGLHALFKRLWADCRGNHTADNVIQQIKTHITIQWPIDSQFGEAIKGRPLYGATITPFILKQLNVSAGGDPVPGLATQQEHILPENPKEGWFDSFTHEQHQEYLNLLANLLPLSPDMNRELSNKLYEVKRASYEVDSVYKSVRQFAAKYESWTPEDLAKRQAELSTWAVQRWPHTVA